MLNIATYHIIIITRHPHSLHSASGQESKKYSKKYNFTSNGCTRRPLLSRPQHLILYIPTAGYSIATQFFFLRNNII